MRLPSLRRITHFLRNGTTQPVVCVVCQEPAPTTRNRTVCADAVCHGCFDSGIVPQFRAALDHESAYPVKWGGTIIHPKDFKKVFGKRFRRAWDAKEAEYSIPPPDRISCQCGKFLGRKIVFSPHPTPATAAACSSCRAETCCHCGRPYKRSEHICVFPESDLSAFGNLKRGRDWQACPRCHITVELSDGCNHMTCRCQQHFCFICGQEAAPDSGHWRDDTCPQYNQPQAQAQQQHNQPQVQPAIQAGAIIVDDDALPPEDIDELFLDWNNDYDGAPPLLRPMFVRSFFWSLNDLRESTETEAFWVPPELAWRKSDRRKLARISMEANSLMEAGMPHAWVRATREMAWTLLPAAEAYTMHLEASMQIRVEMGANSIFNQGVVTRLLTQMGEQGFQRFPQLRGILDRFNLAITDETGLLRAYAE